MKRAPVVITLAEPIELRSATDGRVVDSITTLSFREPRAGDMAAAMDAGGKDGTGTMILALAARCTGVKLRDLEGLSVDDFFKLSEVATSFLGTGLPTGPMRSASSSAPSASPPDGSGGPPPSFAS